MNKLKHIPCILFLSFCILYFSSCSQNTSGSSSQERSPAENGFIPATVINYTIDGCSWMLQLKDGRKLQPLNLSADYQKEDLRVWIKYAVKKDGMSICMAGEMVTLTEISLRKDE